MPKCSRLWDSAEFRRTEGGLEFLHCFPMVIDVDLTPEVDRCYALGPYTLFQANQRHRTEWGDALYQAKYQNDQVAVEHLGIKLEECISSLPLPFLRAVDAIVSAPKSDPNTPDLVGVWAGQLSHSRHWLRLNSYKTKDTNPQKVLNETNSEEDLVSRIAGSVGVTGVAGGERVLILDDTIRSGGTFREMGRALREAGAGSVCGLAVAKDARFTQGGADFLAREWWT